MSEKRKRPDQGRKARILAFVRAHPECTTKDIRAAFNAGLDQIGCCLLRMKAAGLVASEKLEGSRELRWSAVSEDRLDDLPLRRPVRTSWTPHMTRHWLDVALFGAPA